MSIARDRVLVCALVALPSLVLASNAGAQTGVAWTDAAATPRCIALEPAPCVSDATCVAADQSCREFEGGQRACTSTDGLFCAFDSESPCPIDRDVRRMVLGIDLCVSERYVECPTVTNRGVCFTGTGGEFPVDWDGGDCDGDGQKNGLDPLPCQAAAFIATLNPDGVCDASRELCRDDVDCGGGFVCREVLPDDPHEYCLPGPDAAFCCGGFVGASCPNTFECETAGGDDFQHCHTYCTHLSFEQRARCVHYRGNFPVAPEVGDCDDDGIGNDAELESGSDPCSPDDAGVLPEPDAGVIDAGEDDLDAGRAMDASSETPGITFGGGGGCRCGIATSPREAMPWGLVLAALAVWRTRSSRRRRH